MKEFILTANSRVDYLMAINHDRHSFCVGINSYLDIK